MRPVVQQALLKVRDDKTMEGVSFATHYGSHNVRNTPHANPVLAAVRGTAQLENAPYVYKLDDRTGKRDGRWSSVRSRGVI